MSPTSSRTEFSARFFLIEDEGLIDLKVWCHELIPMESSSRASEEWVEEHFSSTSEEDIRDMAKVPKGDFQCLVKGQLCGAMHGYFEPEWDEEMEFTEVTTLAVPKDFLDAYFKEVLGDNDMDPKP